MPAALLEKLKRSRQFDQAWATVMYTGPALIDMALHALPNGTPVDIDAFEAEQCAKPGHPEDIGQRHYLSHFPAPVCRCGLRRWLLRLHVGRGAGGRWL
jgi:peptidyl-dipeptidase Dcp